jgi:hypothetical protein
VNLVMSLLTDPVPVPKPIDKSKVEPGWLGLIFLVVGGGAVSLLWFSMRKQLNRIDVGRHLRERATRSPQQPVPAPPPVPGPPTSASPPGPGT